MTLESYVFEQVRTSVSEEIERLKNAAHIIATTDVLLSLAQTAYKNNFTMPEISDNGKIEITDGRHPVVEKMSKNSMFVPNDTLLNNDDDRMIIITGPNMAGKSTYMRQVALITLMAQIGSFVPAKSAKIGIVDKIFTRVGASDDISSGQSTFMLEMTEVSHILKNATSKSLIILDEIGRGTSTFDGLSIAWAVVEYIQNKHKIGAKTLFATHYHELTELEGKLDSVNNYCIAVKEQGDDIVFLRKIIKGGADKSYGIQVAKLAGVPETVLNRAKELVEKLSNNDIANKAKEIDVEYEPEDYNYDIEKQTTHKKRGRKKTSSEIESEQMGQISMFDMGSSNVKTEDIIIELHDLDLSTTTPIDAMNILYKMQMKLKQRM